MSEDDIQAVQAVIDARIAALQDRDADRAIAMLAPDIVAFEMGPPLALAGAAMRDVAATRAWLESWDGPIAIQVRDQVIVADGTVAFARGLHRFRGILIGGRVVDFWMRSTLCFRKAGGTWAIVHAHSSVPFRAGDFRAALDLVPD